MFQTSPDKKLYREPGHVDNLDDGKDPEIPEDLVRTVVVGGEGVEGEDDGGEDDADHGEDGDDPRPGRGVRLLEEVPNPAPGSPLSEEERTNSGIHRPNG